MDVLSTLVAYLQAPRAVHPRESSFHYPPVSAQFLAGVDAPPGYPSGYAPLRGNISQGMPLFSTNSMPVRAARSSMRGLPPLGLGGSSGSSGSITSHSSSVTSFLAILSPYPPPCFVRHTKPIVPVIRSDFWQLTITKLRVISNRECTLFPIR